MNEIHMPVLSVGKIRDVSFAPSRLRRSVSIVALSLLLGTACFATSVAAAETGQTADDSAAMPQNASAVASTAPARSWVLRLPRQDKVMFRGVVNNDAAGLGSRETMYFGPPGAALIGLIAHGILNASAQNSQLERLQSDADQVLEPFAPVLDRFTYRQLMELGMTKIRLDGPARLATVDEAPVDEWIIETAPVFAMTQDRSALIVDNLVSVYPPGAKMPALAQTVRIVSNPLQHPMVETGAPEPASPWMDDGGRRLTDVSIAMFSESIELALHDLRLPRPSSADQAPQSSYRSVRYRQGTLQRIERAEVLQQHCDRAVVRTLRGWLLSVPLAGGPAAPASCETATAASPP